MLCVITLRTVSDSEKKSRSFSLTEKSISNETEDNEQWLHLLTLLDYALIFSAHES